MRLAALAVAALCINLLTAGSATCAETDLRVRSFRLRHVPVKEANALVRSLIDVRASAVDLPNNQLLLRDTDEKLDAAASILETIDVAPARWFARIVAETTSSDEEVRTLELRERVSWVAAGSEPAEHVQLQLDVREARETLVLGVQSDVAVGGSPSERILRRSLDTQAELADGESLELVRATTPPARAALAHVLGTSAPVKSLRLEIHREDARGARGSGKRSGGGSAKGTGSEGGMGR